MANARRGFAPRRGELTPLSFTDIAGNAIDARHRDDTLQDKRVGAAAAKAATGVTNPDKLEAISERAVDKARRAELTKDLATVKKTRTALHGRIAALRKRLASQRASRRTAKKDDQSDWDSRIQDTMSRIRGLWDEDRALVREAAEIRAEAADLRYDIGQLDDSIAAMPDAVPDDSGSASGGSGSGPTPEDFLDAAAAEAALTPGTADDIAVAEQRVAHFERSLTAAQASGDPIARAAAASALLAARNDLQQLKATNDNTDALNANTQAINQSFSGSNVVNYQGQDWVLRNLAPPSSDRLVGAEVGI
jgi:hypothetical protein